MAPPLTGGPQRGYRRRRQRHAATIYLLREARAQRMPLRVALIDRHGRHGLGQAYSTTHPARLLNSPAGAMSTLAEDPAHLTRWAAKAGLPDEGFLPRSTYGHYLHGPARGGWALRAPNG